MDAGGACRKIGRADIHDLLDGIVARGSPGHGEPHAGMVAPHVRMGNQARLDRGITSALEYGRRRPRRHGIGFYLTTELKAVWLAADGLAGALQCFGQTLEF